MRISLILLLVFIIVNNSYSQNNIYVGANISPSLNIPILGSNSLSPQERFNYSLGLDGLYFFSNQLSMKLGFNYVQKSLIFKDIPDTRNAHLEQNELVSANKVWTFDDLEIYQSVNLPLIINYKFTEEKKASLIFSSGIELGYLFNLKYVWNYENGEEDIWNIKMEKWIASLNFGIGLYQPIADKYILLIIPKYSFDFYPKRGDNNLNFHTIYLDVEFYFKLI